MPNDAKHAVAEMKKVHEHYAGKDQQKSIVKEMTKGAAGGAIGGSLAGPAGTATGAALGALGGLASHLIDRSGK